MRLHVLVVVTLLSGCATNAVSNPRFSNLDACGQQSCQALSSAVRKIESAAGFTLSRVLIANLQDPNAFATRDKNGSPIAVVTMGMLAEVGTDEDAWAGLMGHEIAHLVRRHADSRRAAQASARGAGKVMANIISQALPGVGGVIGGTVAGTATQMAVYGSYTRPQEAEADQLGLEWMVAAGYDPRGLLRLFELLGRRASLPAFLSTHPASQDRARAVEAFIARTPSSAAFAAPPGSPASAQNCADATSEVRLKTVCLTAGGCRHQMEAIRQSCARALVSPCLAAQEGLPTYCGQDSTAYSEKLCVSAAVQVGVFCRD